MFKLVVLKITKRILVGQTGRIVISIIGMISRETQHETERVVYYSNAIQASILI